MIPHSKRRKVGIHSGAAVTLISAGLSFSAFISIDPVSGAETRTPAGASFARAIACEKTHQYDLAVRYYSKALKLDPKMERALVRRGICFRLLGDFGKAHADFKEAMKLDPRDDGPYRERGTLYGIEHKFDSAMNDFEKAISLDPADAASYYERGLVYHHNMKYKEAVSDFGTALYLEKDDDTYTARASSLISLGRYEDALNDLNKAIELDPGSKKAYLLRAALYERQGKRNLAEKDIKKGEQYIRQGKLRAPMHLSR